MPGHKIRMQSGANPASSPSSHWRASGQLRSLRPALSAMVLVGVLCQATTAAAHKLFVFATVQGKSIEGEVYYLGGEVAVGAKVNIVDPNGKSLGETTTDRDGNFSFEPRIRCDHKLVADAGLGHVGEYTVEVTELPSDLPTGGTGNLTTDAKPESPDSFDHQHPPAHGPHEEPGSAEIEDLSHQVAALRRDLDKWKAQLRLQDILGGIGYILGILGLMSYFLGVRRKNK